MSITPEVSAKTLTQLVATEIRVQMARADVRQSQLAREIGKTEQWLSVRLRGRQPIDLNDLALIAQGLRVGVHELLPAPEVTARIVYDPSRPAGVTGDRATQTIVPDHLIRSDDRYGVTTPKPNVRTHRHLAPKGGPFGGGRRDGTRPVSAIPFAKRRPSPTGPGVRPIAI